MRVDISRGFKLRVQIHLYWITFWVLLSSTTAVDNTLACFCAHSCCLETLTRSFVQPAHAYLYQACPMKQKELLMR